MRFLIITILYCFALLLPMLFLNPWLESYYPAYKVNREKIHKEHVADVFILGSSHANSLISEVLSEKLGLTVSSQNHGGADLFEIAYQIESIKQMGTKQKVFIVAFSPFHFYFDNFSFEENDRRTRREKRIRLYASYGNYTSLINRDLSNAIFSLMYPLITPDHLERMFDSKTVAVVADADLKDAEGRDIKEEKGRKNKAACDFLKKKKSLNEQGLNRATYAYRNKDGYVRNMAANAGYSIPERSFNRFYSMVASNKDDLFIIYIPPFWPIYYDYVPSSIRLFNQQSLEKIQNLPNVQFYDDSGLASITSQPCLFYNSDHLNENGAGIFSRIMATRMQSLDWIVKQSRAAGSVTPKQ